ncbi:hypothetical protein [uncultured Nitrospira sp.]|uniref:hypothetical protein n=1 Tax=uncultured Nitrospira sp. TaxID=157176 RepID=UPI003140693D
MFLPLAAAVTTTERVELGTSVIIAFLQKLVAFSCNRRWFLPSLWRSPYGGDGGPPGRAGQAPGAGLPMGGLVSHLAPASHAPKSHRLPPLFQVIHRARSTFIIKQTGLIHAKTQTGALSLIQQFVSAANFIIHLHWLMPDSFYSLTDFVFEKPLVARTPAHLERVPLII